MIMQFLQHLSFWHWLALGLFCLVLELLSGTGFLLWTGIAAGLVSIIRYSSPNITWEFQWIIFSALTVFSAFAWWFFLARKSTAGDSLKLNRRGEQYVGRTFHLADPIINGRGKVHVDDSMWKVECGIDLPVGTQIKVIGIDGTILKVEQVKTL